MSRRINNALLHLTEAGFAAVPRRRPPAAALATARVVSHRGERDNRRVMENTFAAVDPLLASGVWGVEFDLRWTRDDEPVVCHDADLKRVFGIDLRLADIDYATLRARCPQVPHLGDFVARYGARLHLMMELKAGSQRHRQRRQIRLQACLDGLQPGTDLHVLSLLPSLFDQVPQMPHSCWLPVAGVNCREIGDYALANGCAGMAGPYALLRQQQIDRHHAAGQRVAVGFPAHRSVLYREVARGVDWLFSNRAVRLQRLLDEASGG